MKTHQIRQLFIDFFKSRGHHVEPSASLVSSDPTLLFTVAGMVPFIPYFLGTAKPPYKRAVSVQKCIRTLDIEEVGKTTRHGTFFQMNGNFSFGDYFKDDCIRWAWEFITLPVAEGGLGIDPDVISVSIYHDDEESYKIWKEVANLPDEKIYRRGMKDNYWSTGHKGSAGPCSEIFVDRGEEFGSGTDPYENEDRFLEIWNLVFTQYERAEETDANGEFAIIGDLKQKNIDTGMGLERVAALLQGKRSIYDTDEIFPVIEAVEQLAHKKYLDSGRDAGDSASEGGSERDDVQMRIIADHVRSCLMLINDGVRPSNADRGYVLRRLMRRSIRSLKLLGVKEKVLTHLFEVSKEQMQHSYPELNQNWQNILSIVQAEEDSFTKTLREGSKLLERQLSKSGGSAISGKDAFLLHDTYGFPIDLTVEIAGEHGMSVDLEGFKQHMETQKQRARQDSLKKREAFEHKIYDELAAALQSQFTGYGETKTSSKIIAIVQNGVSVPVLKAGGEAAELILEKSPFYATKGGQVADRGTIYTKDAAFTVNDVSSPAGSLIVHAGSLASGELVVGDLVTAKVDQKRRAEIAKSHTATHILHQSLIDNLGKNATQAGSETLPDRFRFDFHYKEKLSKNAKRDIEQEANEVVQEDYPVITEVMSLDEAKKQGAMALFSEKYGQEVRVVSFGNGWSKELCAGTHIDRLGKIGSIALSSESSIGSGVRRIQAAVGMHAYKLDATQKDTLGQIAEMLNVSPSDAQGKITELLDTLKTLKKKPTKTIDAAEFAKTHRQTRGSVSVVVAQVELSAKELKELAGRLSGIDFVALFGSADQKVSFVIKSSVPTINAGEIARQVAPILGGGGGGNATFATGGGSKADQIDAAIREVEKSLE
jgi:alanyl-tRNA synthetase